MPDLQTELSKVINAWDSDTAPQTQATQTTQTTQPQPQENQMDTSKSISEQVFQYVQAFPGYKTNEYAHRLKPALNFHTVKTLINQMVRAGHMRKDPDGRVQVVIDGYRPVPSNKKIKQMHKPKKVTQIVMPRTVERAMTILEQAKVAAPVQLPKPAPAHKLTAEYVMENIGIAEGKKLFTLLSNVF